MPDPVGAIKRRFSASRARAADADWMGVGVLKPLRSRDVDKAGKRAGSVGSGLIDVSTRPAVMPAVIVLFPMPGWGEKALTPLLLVVTLKIRSTVHGTFANGIMRCR